MTRKVVSGEEAQKLLREGVDIIGNAVGSTLGPLGQNVIIETPYGATTVTKDGVTVAKVIDLEDPIQNLGAQIIKQAAARTANDAGDGTTTSTVIAQTIFKEAQKLISAGVAPITIKRDLEAYLIQALNKIRADARPVDESKIKEIASISANNDESIGNLISNAFEYVGKDGLITIEDSKTGSTYVDLVDGISIDRGYASPYFITNSTKATCVLEKPLILLTDRKLRQPEELIPVLELCHAASRPLLIIADEVDGAMLSVLIANKMRGILQVCVVRAPSFGDRRSQLLEDLCALTSSTYISDASALRLQDVTIEQLGTAARVTISKDSTLIVDGKKNEPAITDRATQIHSLLESTDDAYTSKKLQERLANLTAKVAVLKVGASTETELKEIKDRVDDALRATSCAIQKGYLVGGGAYLAKMVNKDIKFDNPQTFNVFKKGLEAPLFKICTNANASADLALSNILASTDPDFGYNARTATFGSLIQDGVIDPALVIEKALANAISAANMLMLSSTAIYNNDRKAPYSPGNLDDYAQA